MTDAKITPRKVAGVEALNACLRPERQPLRQFVSEQRGADAGQLFEEARERLNEDPGNYETSDGCWQVVAEMQTEGVIRTDAMAGEVRSLLEDYYAEVATEQALQRAGLA